MIRLRGMAAIEYVEENGKPTLGHYANPIDDARDDISLDLAREVAREDANLVYCDVKGIAPQEVACIADFPVMDESYRILRDPDSGRYGFAWGPGFRDPEHHIINEVPPEDVPDGESGIAWHDSRSAAEDAMRESIREVLSLRDDESAASLRAEVDLQMGDGWLDGSTGTYRAAIFRAHDGNELVMTLPEERSLPDDELIALAVTEARSTGLIGPDEDQLTEEAFRQQTYIGDWTPRASGPRPRRDDPPETPRIEIRPAPEVGEHAYGVYHRGSLIATVYGRRPGESWHEALHSGGTVLRVPDDAIVPEDMPEDLIISVSGADESVPAEELEKLGFRRVIRPAPGED